MSRRNDRFNDRMASFDALAEECDVSKWCALSDRGRSVAHMVAALDGPGLLRRNDHSDPASRARLACARRRLVLAGKGHLVPVLMLIVKNGKHRKLSLRKISASTYFWARNELLRFFSLE